MSPPASPAQPLAPRPAAPRELPVLRKSPKPGYQRVIEVGLRSLHLVSMGLVLGGIGMGGTHDTLVVPIYATLATGTLLLAVCVRWGCLQFTHGAGSAILLKLALLGAGNLFDGARLPFYATATVVSSVGSHMPSTWRHFPVAGWLRWAIGMGPRPA